MDSQAHERNVVQVFSKMAKIVKKLEKLKLFKRLTYINLNHLSIKNKEDFMTIDPFL